MHIAAPAARGKNRGRQQGNRPGLT